MKIHRACLAVLPLLLAGPAPAQELLSATSASAGTKLVPLRGIVTGSPESVSFSGDARVSSRLAKDPDFNSPRLVLTIDLRGVTGVGSMTGAKYAVWGPELVQRRVASSHTVEITFPFKSDISPTAATARTGVASLVLDFDVNTGAVTGASGGVSSPNFPR